MVSVETAPADMPFTNYDYRRINAYNAILEVQKRTYLDPNGYLGRAELGPSLPRSANSDVKDRHIFRHLLKSARMDFIPGWQKRCRSIPFSGDDPRRS